MTVVGAVLIWLLATSAVLAVAYRRAFAAAWQEPVLRAPVLILESDDWGYGPPAQAEWLDRIADVLASFRDAAGRHPIATLGVVLAGPDPTRTREDGGRFYRRVALDDPRLESVRDAMLRGAARGVFGLQLHGLEHFWPPSLMRSAEKDPRIRNWLTGDSFGVTEDLPSALQSRWIDASALPSAALPEPEATAAATEEARIFAAVFDAAPEVVVPSTFIWTDAVERAWVRAGVRVIVTPGVRNESRDADGRVVPGDLTCFNGQRTPEGATYVVRDVYFEPSLGHDHRRALAAVRARVCLAQPALLEMHRLNFIRDGRTTQNALDELSRLLRAALATFPALRFMSTAELARQYRERSPLMENRTSTRLHFLIRRLAELSRLRKLAWLTGAALPAWVAYVLTRPANLRASKC